MNRLPRGEWTKDINVMKLAKAGLSYTHGSNDDIAIFREPGKPTIEFNLRKNRWRCRGDKKSVFGTVDQFVKWYRAKRGEA